MATTIKARVRPAPVLDTAQPVVAKHHWLVRITHWLNIPFLLGMSLSGMSIYWAAPVYKHAYNNTTGTDDYIADLGSWLVAHVPGLHGYPTPQTWVYDHFGLGTGMLATALSIHWFFAYLFMLNGLLYLVGLGLGGGYKALLPRRSDISGAFRMIRYYLGLVPSKILRRAWPHPIFKSKYNALQKSAYFAMPVMGTLSVITGWVMHKAQQLGWLQGLVGGYDYARVWHFWLMWIFLSFVIPHVILVIADGWDTFRSMIVGWSDRVGEPVGGQNDVRNG